MTIASASGTRHIDRYDRAAGTVLLSGVEALARVPMDQRRADVAAGRRTAGFIAGYPGSPLAGYDMELARNRQRLTALGIVHQPAVNEELAATAVAGSQLAAGQRSRTVDGVSALWYGKAPGLDRASDAIRHGNLMGASRHGGVLVCVGDDPQARSSSVPSTSEPTLYGLGLPFLSPADPQEILDLGRHGFALSRAAGLWVGLRLPASVADASQTVVVDPDRVQPIVPELLVGGRRFVHQPTAQLLGATLVELERSLYGPRLAAARRYGAVNGLNRIVQRGPRDVLGVAAAGPAYLAVRGALHRLGLADADLAGAGIRLLKVAMPYPLDPELVREFAGGLREVVVVEDKRAFLELVVRDALYGTADAPLVVGKHDEAGRELVPPVGEVDPDLLVEVLARRLLRWRDVEAVRRRADAARPRPPAPLAVVRGPYFCSGCPHNTGVKVPAGALVGSGSGCHGLAIQMDPRQVGEVVGRFQMGGEGAMWNGMAPFVSADHFVQNLGDGTFAHSGSLAVRAAVAAGVDITFKLLVNSAVAMTGGQDVAGGHDVADLTRLLLAEGVGRVIVTSDRRGATATGDLPAGVEVWPRDRIVEAQRALAGEPGVTVLLHDQPCAADLRRRRARGLAPTPTRRVFINPLVCDGCGACGAVSNCLSVRPVETERGRVSEIHQESCNLDYACLDADCPALVVVDDADPFRPPATAALRADQLPPPDPAPQGGAFTIRIVGVGGTGVVTAARIVAVAAHLRGRPVRGVDQTGIAQKGGSVASDLRIGAADAGGDPAPHRLGAGECDLYLGCDPVAAAEPRHLGAATADRTVAVMSSSLVPTGRQVADRSIAPLAVDDVRSAVAARTRPGTGVWIDAAGRCRALFGTDTSANVMLLGAAYQLGALPLDAEAIEQAIAAHGVAVAVNLQAFRHGRLVVAGEAAGTDGPQRHAPAPAEGPQRHAPAPADGPQRHAPAPADGPRSPTPPEEAATAPGADPGVASLLALIGAAPGSTLEQLAAWRVADLVRYQNRAYARRYAALIGRCRRAEAERCAIADGPFAHAAAVELHRLMAARDEYEVAALHRTWARSGAIARRFGPDARVSYRLHPAALRRLGIARPVVVGPAAEHAFDALRALRHLRGTALDPFGRDQLRRLERQVRDDYESTLEHLCDTLSSATHAAAVTVAELPQDIRGYGPVKEAALQRYQQRRRQLHAPLPA